MTNLAPIQQNNFEFPFAKRWSSLGMNYDNCPHFSITQYKNLIDHLGQDDFIWRPYLGLENTKIFVSYQVEILTYDAMLFGVPRCVSPIVNRDMTSIVKFEGKYWENLNC
ncbi:unnamed protein product [Lathyrus sativus]|nr:unnamed protein product [Lathyrus sativus]